MVHLYKTFFSLLLLSNMTLYGLETAISLLNQSWEVPQTFSQTVEKNMSELEKLKALSQEQLNSYKVDLDVAQKSLSKAKEELTLQYGIERDFTSQKVDILNKSVQVLSDLVLVGQELIDIRSTHIKMLEEYKDDPEFTKKGLHFEQRSIYSVEDFQRITSIIVRYDNELTALKERLAKSAADSEGLRENLRLIDQELQEKQQEQGELKEQTPVIRLERKRFSLKQRGALLDLEERQIYFQRVLADSRLKKANAQAQLMELEAKVLLIKLDLLKKQEEHVRRELRVDRKDIELSEAALKKQIDESTEVQKKLNDQIETTNRRIQEIKDKIDQLKKKYSLTEGQLEEIYAWTDTPASTSQWVTLIEVARYHTYLVYTLEVMKDILLAQVALEKAKVTRQEVENLVISTWGSLTSGLFDGDAEALSKEIKKYEKIQSDLFNSLAALADRRDAASKLLTDTARIHQAIKERLKALRDQQTTTFSSDGTLYKQLNEILRTEDSIEAQKRSEYSTQLLELYASISQLRIQTNQKVEIMLRALQAKSHTGLVPPLWNGVKRFIPDMVRFCMYVVEPGQLQKSSISLLSSFSLLWHTLAGPTGLGMALFVLMLLFLLVSLALIYLGFRFALRQIAAFLALRVPPSYGIVTFLGGLLTILVYFVVDHLATLFPWSLAYFAVRAGYLNTYSSVLFYIFSILLWLYYVRRLVRYAQKSNQLRNYQIAGESYQERFFYVLYLLLTSTAAIFFVGHAVALVLPQSDAPRILQTLNFIIVQVSLIFMISRSQIYKFIPQNTPFGKWLFELIDTYYYLFVSSLIFIIIMSNPYIGYGATFMHHILRFVLILLLIPLIVTLHGKVKDILGTVFLQSDETGVATERFSYARTSYGILIIGSFIFFSAGAVLLALNIWGYSIGLKEIFSWLRKDLYGYTSPETGRRVSINAYYLVRVTANIVIGIVLGFTFIRIVFARIFDLLLVKASLQSIIYSLTRYLIVLIALLVGLSSLGLGTTWMFYLLAIVGGLGVAGKDILADFIGYFMILIQRPLKIGDFVKIDEEFIGVVRQLTLRSVILRKKNSVTLIVPNSYLLSKPLTNWNYYRMYFAFDDILVTVPYSTDPDLVKKIFLKVLHENFDVLRNPAPIVRLENFTEHGYEFMIRGYLSHEKVLEQYDLASDLRLALVRSLKEHGYNVAIPTRVIHVKKGEHTDLHMEIDE